jgi:uncharacterized protein
MKKVALNLQGRKVLQGYLAEHFAERLKGLMFSPELDPGSALILPRCQMVHMFFLKFPLDLIFCNSAGEIVGLESGLRPWRISKYYRQADYTVECRRETIIKLEAKLGEKLTFEQQP